MRIVQGNPVSTLTPVPAKDAVPCRYGGATFGEVDQGKSVSVQASRPGYQDALVIATVEGECHPATFSPTIELRK